MQQIADLGQVPSPSVEEYRCFKLFQHLDNHIYNDFKFTFLVCAFDVFWIYPSKFPAWV